MKDNKFLFLGTLIMGMALAAALVSCATTGGPGGGGTAELPAAPDENLGDYTAPPIPPKLAEALGKYAAPEAQPWDGEGNAPTYVYNLDPLRFNQFKAELDAGGEYQQTDNWTEKNQDWVRGMTFAQWAVRPNGEFILRLCKADNSVNGYRYTKAASNRETPKLEAALGKYLAPRKETWGDVDVYVYYVDPARFEAFKAEVVAGGEYSPTYIETDKNRDWDRGKSFARWIVYPGGNGELWLCRADNSLARYTYIPTPQTGEPKFIRVTGIGGVKGRFINTWATVKPVQGAVYAIAGGGPINSSAQEVTFKLTFWVLQQDDKTWVENAWTGSGSYYISLWGPPRNAANLAGHYWYSVNGVDPAPVDINAAVTTLEWSNFIHDRDQEGSE